MKINIEDIEFQFRFHDNEQMPATMTLLIGQFAIRGFKIMKSKFTENKYPFTLFPPSSRTGSGSWIDIFWTDIKNDWEFLKRKALEQFSREHAKYLLEKDELELKKEGNVDDIKFG